ncbi:hypothetical protein VC83_08382 [Pseudogymnoascus destructans]|uniref:Uncharacterized protein n=1 Tax=Pseudogymnoascus destructans TaxID=655981 RepID=A0A177A1L6_9PEZI|nr:uncharacterized protein VC83_08382 [Pseudogymnoascus destructans]OAF55382.1 hypothetical protein VC83_08382 [Pseudogymnoascus destructans]
MRRLIAVVRFGVSRCWVGPSAVPISRPYTHKEHTTLGYCQFQHLQFTRRFVVTSPSSETVCGKNDSFVFPRIANDSASSHHCSLRRQLGPDQLLPQQHLSRTTSTTSTMRSCLAPRYMQPQPPRSCDRKLLILFTLEKLEYITWKTLNFDITSAR